MSKLDDYEFRDVSQSVNDFKDDTRDLLNNGKYQSSVATTGIPGWSANTGEFAFYSSGSDRRLYLRAATSWQLVAGFDPTLLPSALGTINAGTGNTFSQVDHIHALQTTSPAVTFGTPVAVGTANLAGTSTDATRADHVHLGYLVQGSMQAFTGNGTWTRPSGISNVYVKAWGGGGGGGAGRTGGAGGGGGGGGYAEAFTMVTGDVTVTVGAGGAGSNTDGANGGNTSFGTAVTASGGSGGGLGTATGVLPVRGGSGGAGTVSLVAASGGAGSTLAIGAEGGGAPLGGTGGHGGAGAVLAGEGGIIPGGGGGGAGASATEPDGGPGASGMVLVYW